ncbi:MAG: hypothetical protein R3270_09250 [Gammaproteobacteria bacterium]|nr:hypothetical protein [Gammaproteobacteria bacterium]
MGKINPFDIFSDTFGETFRWIHLFLPIALVFQLVVMAMNMQFLGSLTGQLSPETTEAFIGNFWTAWSVMMIVGLTLHVLQLSLFDAVLEQRADWFSFGISRALRRLLPVLIGMVIFIAAYMVGILLLIIPGLMVLFLLYMMTPLILLDGRGPFEAVKASWQLTWGNAWRLVGAVLLVFLPVLIVSMLVGMTIGMMEGPLPAGQSPEVYGWGDWQTWVMLLVFALLAVIFTCFYLAAFRELKSARNAAGETTA